MGMDIERSCVRIQSCPYFGTVVEIRLGSYSNQRRISK